jgi:nitroimidazol reductase NimA-like FMN-containing flavoprotein (pyridoxamine 5'-phosphate oxidase superfamily)
MRVIRDRPRSVDLDEFLSQPLFAHLATASDDGPRESPVWFLWEEGALWILGSRRTDSFPARIEGEPRCAVGVVDFDVTTGLVQHVGFRGRATVEELDRERAKRLLARYLGTDEAWWDPRFRETLGDPDTVFVRFGPDTAVTRDVSYSPPQEESRSEN